MKFVNLIDWKLFEKCSKLDIDNSIENKLLKLSEEVGELSAIWLAYKNASNKSKSALKELENEGIDKIIEEALDVLLVIGDIIVKLKQDLDVDDNKIAKIFNRKLEKWNTKLL